MAQISLKVSYGNSTRRMTVPVDISWAQFELAARELFGLSSIDTLNILYRDPDGDIITLSTDLELQDLLGSSQGSGATLKFLLTTGPATSNNVATWRFDSSSVSSEPVESAAPITMDLGNDDSQSADKEKNTKNSAEGAADTQEEIPQASQEILVQLANLIDQFRDVFERNPNLGQSVNALRDQILHQIPVSLEVFAQWLGSFRNETEGEANPPGYTQEEGFSGVFSNFGPSRSNFGGENRGFGFQSGGGRGGFEFGSGRGCGGFGFGGGRGRGEFGFGGGRWRGDFGFGGGRGRGGFVFGGRGGFASASGTRQNPVEVQFERPERSDYPDLPGSFPEFPSHGNPFCKRHGDPFGEKHGKTPFRKGEFFGGPQGRNFKRGFSHHHHHRHHHPHDPESLRERHAQLRARQLELTARQQQFLQEARAFMQTGGTQMNQEELRQSRHRLHVELHRAHHELHRSQHELKRVDRHLARAASSEQRKEIKAAAKEERKQLKAQQHEIRRQIKELRAEYKTSGVSSGSDDSESSTSSESESEDEPDVEGAMEKLRAMGFEDNDVNRAAIAKHRGDVEAVVAQLLAN
ncbi:hypothetical protein BC937DRAFT_92851 [Endogone sp. FLAS-F59071]|nr:hypothetical protein BC937DRAFT_92851 [Endogone sp. FLAS-F59071]|eukprot:RUS15141.1 hypothetical protein BC937DRAFT_92851 [Endogone sp. FLAS-F59071]